MNRQMHCLVGTALLMAAFRWPCPALALTNEGDPAAEQRLNLGLRGVYFVPNQGQWSDAGVVYGLRSRGVDVAFRESALTMHVMRDVDEQSETTEASPTRERGFTALNDPTPHPRGDGSLGESGDVEHLTLTVSFPGSNNVMPVGGRPQTARFNYFVGGEGRSTASDVPSFGEVVYEELYDGVDLHVTGSDDGVLKYEFHVAPGADYGQIRIAYDGIESLCVDAGGDLHITTSFGTLVDAAPIAWYAGDVTDSVEVRFELIDGGTYRLAVGEPISPCRELIIDPDVEWMYYLGGSDSESASSIALDSAGNSLFTGITYSTDFEGRNNASHGDHDAFVVKVSASGILQWMTYLGGNDWENGNGIAVDSADNALVTGNTYSIDFEGRNNAHHGGLRDAFVVKVSASGILQWMTYLGGSGVDWGFGIAADSVGDAMVTGETLSTDFEGRNNAHHGDHDAFVAKVSASGALQWMTCLGGSGGDGGSGIAVDRVGNAVVTGITDSTDFEGRNNANHGGSDACVVKVSASGILRGMTYLGGNDLDWGNGIAVDRAGNALVTGATQSADFEGRNNSHHGYWDGFVVKVSASGALQWMTYFGGSDWDDGSVIAVDSAGNALVTGVTQSADFDGRNNASHGGYNDAFVVEVSTSGALQWMTYLGGNDYDWGNGIAVDSVGDALVAGTTESPDFEGRNNSHHGGRYYDAFLVKLRLADGLQLNVTATCPSGGPIQISWTGATRARLAALIFASEQGAFVLPPHMPCAGTALGLGRRQLQVVWTGNTGPDGSGSIGRFAGPNACGGYLQLLDLSTCTTSNVVRIE